jgi:hypothetical protein
MLEKESLSSINTQEAKVSPDQQPTTLKQIMKAATHTLEGYFKLRDFERDSKIYEKVGIRTFKRYLPTTGDLMWKHVWKKLGQEDWVKNETESLEDMELATQIFEAIHVVLLVIGPIEAVILANIANPELNILWGIIASIANTYAIMLQRYNRARLQRTIKRATSRNNSSRGIPVNNLAE